MSLVTRLIRSPGPAVVMVSERKSLDVEVDGLLEIVHHPPADAFVVPIFPPSEQIAPSAAMDTR